jgi:mRNA interferase MazF
VIFRGEIYDVDLGSPIGHEPAFTRPAVVISTDVLNNGPGGLVTVIPVGSARYGLRSHIELNVGNSGLDRVSFARCDQLRTVSTERLRRRRGTAAGDEISLMDQAIRFVLDL